MKFRLQNYAIIAITYSYIKIKIRRYVAYKCMTLPNIREYYTK
jgi:hypothetical protein